MKRAAVLGIVLAGLAAGQGRWSGIGGRVVDETGAVLDGVEIVAERAGTGERRRTTTGGDGTYRLDRLELGVYSITAAREGFQTSRHDGVQLVVDRVAVADHRLRVGQRSESVVVSGEARLIEATPSALTSLVDTGAIEQLPLNGRDYMQLVAVQAGAPVAAGVDRDVNTGYGLQVSISGSRPFQNSFRLDGLTYTSYNGATPGSINGINLGTEAIGEFSVGGSANSAQSGQAAGGVITAVTRSGTNEFHGAAVYFHRNDNLDARNFFDGEKKPEFRRHQFGGALGGPVVRNRTFFFANAEEFREGRGNTTINTTLSAAAREGRLAGGTVAVDPAIRRLLEFYPQPNGEVLGDTGLFTFTNDVRGTQRFLTGRLDHAGSEMSRWFFRATRDIGERWDMTDFAMGERRNGTRQHAAVLEHSRIFSPRAMNSARAGVLRSGTVFGRTATLVPGTDTRDLAFTPESGVLGLVLVAGLTDHPGGSGATGGDRHVLNSYQLSDDFQWTAARHSLRFGGRLERTHFNTDSQVRPVGEYRFRSLAQFLTNVPDRFRGMYPGADAVRGHRQWIGAGYAEDSWRVNSRLTVDVGARWEWATVPVEVNGKMANLVGLTDAAMRVGTPMFANPSWANVVPRVGAAWDVRGDGATVLRGGFGMSPDLILSPYLLLSGVRNPPFFQRGELRGFSAGDFPRNGYAKFLAAARTEQSVERMDPEPRQPMVRQWNVNVERRLTRAMSARAAYVGSRGVNLSNVVTDANTVAPGIDGAGRVTFPAGGRVINPNFGGIRNRRFDTNSYYHGLQTWLVRRFAKGAQMQLTYTFSKSIDDSSNFSSSSEGPNRGMLPFESPANWNRGLSGHDVRHYVTMLGYWELPGAWQLGGIFTYSSGVPTTVWMGYDGARTLSHQAGANLAQRPDARAGYAGNPVTGDPNGWVDIGAFARPAAGVMGNLGRNTIGGPNLANADLSVVKRLRVTERATIDVRMEFFNVLNRTNFRLPALERMESFYETAPRSDFARITSSEESREVQVGIRIRF